MIEALKMITDRLRDAEYLHVLLETLPAYGILGGTLLLVLAVALKDNRFRIIALSITLVSSLSFYPQLQNRKLAEGPMLEVSSAEKGKLITAQTKLRASKQWAYLGLAAGCLLTLATRRTKIGSALLALTVVGGMAVSLLSTWLHIKDTEILHPNVKLGPGTEIEVVPPGLPGTQP